MVIDTITHLPTNKVVFFILLCINSSTVDKIWLKKDQTIQIFGLFWAGYFLLAQLAQSDQKQSPVILPSPLIKLVSKTTEMPPGFGHMYICVQLSKPVCVVLINGDYLLTPGSSAPYELFASFFFSMYTRRFAMQHRAFDHACRQDLPFLHQYKCLWLAGL